MNATRSQSAPRKILVIDQNKSLATEMEKVLSVFGFEAFSTTQWRKAVGMAKEHKPDLICIEVGIRGRSGGVEIAQQIWEELQIPALFIAKPSEATNLEQAKNTMEVGHVLKPFDEKVLHCALELAFNRIERYQAAQEEKADLQGQVSQRDTELQNAQAQLLQAQKMESIGALTAGIAHDFNNVLLPILGCSSLLSDALEANPKLKDLADQIQQAGQSASSLSRQLLNFTRCHEETEKEVSDIHRLIKSQQVMLNRLLGEKYNLELDLDAEAFFTLIDRSQIEQVLTNMCINARDAMEPGGKITIGTRKLGEEVSKIQAIKEKVQSDWMCLTIKDEGCGMSPQTVRRIFEPFFSTKEGEGTGLGLSVVHGIITQHDGHIHVESAPGKGSEFQIYLPLENVQEMPTEQSVPAEPARTSRTGSESILIIEDDPRVSTFVTQALTNRGYQISSAEDLASAKRLLKRARREDGSCGFDLIFSDCVLPDGNGADFIKEESQNHPDTKFLLSTGYAEGDQVSEEAAHMGIAFLQKPYPLAKLFGVIRDILDENESQGEELAKAS